VNIQYTCPACATKQTTIAEVGDGVEVPECANPACTAQPQWGAITVPMLQQAVIAVAQTHATQTAMWTAVFIMRLLFRVRRVPAVTDPDAQAVWQQTLDVLARR
jgi:hypothetical protein